MTPEAAQRRVQELLDGRERSAGAWRLLGIEIVALEPGRAVLAMAAGEAMANINGNVHGGFISALADCALGLAVASVLPDGERHATFDLKMTFIAPAEIGERLEATAGVIHAGRRTAVAEARMEAPGGRLLATATGSFAVHRPGPDSRSEGR